MRSRPTRHRQRVGKLKISLARPAVKPPGPHPEPATTPKARDDLRGPAGVNSAGKSSVSTDASLPGRPSLNRLPAYRVQRSVQSRVTVDVACASARSRPRAALPESSAAREYLFGPGR